MNTVTRVEPVTPGTRPEQGDIERAILAERGRITLLYQVLLNNPWIAEGWEKMLSAVRKRSSLLASVRELVILRVAVLNDAPHEFESHIPHAEHAGVSAEKIAAVRDEHPGTAFTPQERIALELTDAMTRTVRVPDALFGVCATISTIAAWSISSPPWPPIIWCRAFW